MSSRLLEKYKKVVVPAMQEKFKIKTAIAVPSIKKVVVNMGVGEALTDIKMLDKAQEELGVITGQKPVICRAKQSIANFKTREGVPISTLR